MSTIAIKTFWAFQTRFKSCDVAEKQAQLNVYLNELNLSNIEELLLNSILMDRIKVQKKKKKVAIVCYILNKTA